MAEETQAPMELDVVTHNTINIEIRLKVNTKDAQAQGMSVSEWIEELTRQVINSISFNSPIVEEHTVTGTAITIAKF